MSYIDESESARGACKAHSKQVLPSLGERLPRCVGELNTLLPLLEGIACCYWWCPGKDEVHIVQRIVGRGVSHCLAGLELAYSGHYDEALALARSIGESVNLTWLFSLDPETLREWLMLDERQRWNKYRPAEVRRKIEARNSPAPIDNERYSSLSAEAAHITPLTSPQLFNSMIPTLGGHYQEAGLIVSINELAGPVAILAASSIRILTDLPNQYRKDIYDSSLRVLDSVGGVDLVKFKEIRDAGRT